MFWEDVELLRSTINDFIVYFTFWKTHGHQWEGHAYPQFQRFTPIIPPLQHGYDLPVF